MRQAGDKPGYAHSDLGMAKPGRWYPLSPASRVFLTVFARISCPAQNSPEFLDWPEKCAMVSLLSEQTKGDQMGLRFKPFNGVLTPRKRPGIITRLIRRLGIKSSLCQGTFARDENGHTCQNQSPRSCSHCALGWMRLVYMADVDDSGPAATREQSVAYSAARERFVDTAKKLYRKELGHVLVPTVVSINDAYLTPRKVFRVFEKAGL